MFILLFNNNYNVLFYYMAENKVLHMRLNQQLEILTARIKPLTKMNGSEVSGDELKQIIKDIVHSNKHKNLRGSIGHFVLSGLKLNKSSEESLKKSVTNAYNEMRFIAEYTPNTQSARNEREAETAMARHSLRDFRRNLNASRNRNASNARHRAFTVRQGQRNSAASLIQRTLSRRSRRPIVTMASVLPSIRNSTRRHSIRRRNSRSTH